LAAKIWARQQTFYCRWQSGECYILMRCNTPIIIKIGVVVLLLAVTLKDNIYKCFLLSMQKMLVYGFH